jgi:hypothetical protein
MGTGAIFPELNRSRQEVNHSHLSSAEIWNEWGYTPTGAQGQRNRC